MTQKGHPPCAPFTPLWAPGGARRAPCGFWSALSHRLGRPRAANPCISIMYVCIYVCMYVCVYTYMYVCTSLYLYDLNHHHVCHVNENQYGITALMMASEKGHKDIAKLLTDKGADLNIQENVSVPLYV